MWRTIALSQGLYAFANLPWNEAILNNFLSATSCRKLVLVLCFLSSLGKMETENTFTGTDRLPRVGYDGERQKGRRQKRGEGGFEWKAKGDKERLEVGAVRKGSERMKR